MDEPREVMEVVRDLVLVSLKGASPRQYRITLVLTDPVGSDPIEVQETVAGMLRQAGFEVGPADCAAEAL